MDDPGKFETTILLDLGSRSFLAGRIESLRRPDSIDIDTWTQLREGRMCAIPMKMLGQLVDVCGWQLVGDLIAASRWSARDVYHHREEVSR